MVVDVAHGENSFLTDLAHTDAIAGVGYVTGRGLPRKRKEAAHL